MRELIRRSYRFLVIAILVLASPSMSTVSTPAAENSLFGTYAELPGVKLWFTDTSGTGVPIVLLHANTGTSAVWESQVASSSRAGYRVIAFDRRGWGKSIGELRPRSPRNRHCRGGRHPTS